MNRLTGERLEILLERMRSVRVLVVGDLMLDVYLRGSASRISPEAPVPVIRIEEEWRAPGGAANVAANVVSLGAACSAAGCVGEDDTGSALRRELDRHGIDHEGVLSIAGRATTVKTRVMARHQQIARYDIEEDGDIDEQAAHRLCAVVREAISSVDAIVIEDYDKGVLVRDVVRDTLTAAAEAGKCVVVDPKLRSFFEYRGSTVFKPNQRELETALQSFLSPDDPDWMARTKERLGCANLLLTLGERGMALLTDDGEFVRVPAVARSVYDVSGAGDTVSAVVATAIAAGAEVAEAAILANHAAGIQVGKTGVATVTPDELRAGVDRFARSGT